MAKWMRDIDKHNAARVQTWLEDKCPPELRDELLALPLTDDKLGKLSRLGDKTLPLYNADNPDRVRHRHRGRNPEMGEGHPIGEHQDELRGRRAAIGAFVCCGS